MPKHFCFPQHLTSNSRHTWDPCQVLEKLICAISWAQQRAGLPSKCLYHSRSRERRVSNPARAEATRFQKEKKKFSGLRWIIGCASTMAICAWWPQSSFCLCLGSWASALFFPVPLLTLFQFKIKLKSWVFFYFVLADNTLEGLQVS